MAQSISFLESSFLTTAVTKNLYKAPEHSTLKLTASGKYVTHNPAKDSYVCTAEAMLEPTVDEDENNGVPYMVAADEKDISDRLQGVTKPTYMLQVGVAWDTGEMTSLLCLNGGIVEYRRNIGVESARVNAVTGTKPCYMVTYASIGVPIQRYSWMVSRLAEIGLDAGPGGRDTEANDYMWITANITRGFHPPAVIRNERGDICTLGDDTMNLRAAITNLKKNVTGVLAVEVTLKRAPDFSMSGRRTIAFSLKCMQIVDVTDIGSPPLNRAVEFAPASTGTSTRVLEGLRRQEKAAEAHTPASMPAGARLAF
uniref:AlNc14C654G12339 protein n=1 Tax=Albugo laibachii Nc14 TaxID=890382 RepID=F0X1M7_9STRA|nr:AlNc14C654G12339 [Albugo laibachii Nc14]|eukprot:CCA27723.1 AlNc14C654G12339 [Albugo laibachii Nc14]